MGASCEVLALGELNNHGRSRLTGSRPRGDVDYIHDGYIMRRMTKSSPGAAHGGGLPYPPRPLQAGAPRLRHHAAGQRRPTRPHDRGAPCRQEPHKGSAQDLLRAHSAWAGDLEGGRRAALSCCGYGAPPFISCGSQSQSYARWQLTKYMIVQVQFPKQMIFRLSDFTP
jgi:hypothetical protein